jgi:hypothetical protein
LVLIGAVWFRYFGGHTLTLSESKRVAVATGNENKVRIPAMTTLPYFWGLTLARIK